MKRLFGYILVVLCVSLACAQRAEAAPEGTWAGATVSVHARGYAGSAPVNGSTCAGRVQPILLEGEVLYRDGCVYGGPGGTQVARYWDSMGGFLYAISFVGDTHYAGLIGLCERESRCVYSQSEDVFLLHHGFRTSHVIIEDFTQHLVRRDTLTRAYQLVYDKEYRYVTPGGLASNSVGISEDGRWAAIELLYYGFIRVDLRTFEFKRIVAPGVRYGYGADPTFEVGVSNDGRQVAISGWNAGLDIYEISDGCGDVLGENPSDRFESGARVCSWVSPDRSSLFPGLYMVQQPRFIGNGSHLSVLTLTTNGYESAVLSPFGEGEERFSGYVAFGDSFTSGEGEVSDSFYVPGTNTADNRCHVSTRSYPFLLGTHWGVGVRSAACSGARTNEVSLAIQKQITLGDAPEVISLGVGGNDIGFMDKLKACIMPGTCEWVGEEKRRAGAAEIAGMFPKIVNTIQQLRAAYPQSQLFVVGYPEVINDSVGAPCSALVSTLLNVEERRYMNEAVRYLNEVLRQAAYHEDVRFFDVGGSYAGARLCDDPPEAMNAIRLGDDMAPLSFAQDIKLIGAESFHPTPMGHVRLAAHIAQESPQLPLGTCATCQFDATKLAPSGYWVQADEPIESTTRIIASSLLERVRYAKGEAMRILVPKGLFAPRATVRIELHSSPVYLGTFELDGEGMLDVTLATDELSPGYHTMHVVGVNGGGEQLDAYQGVYIAGRKTEGGALGLYTPVTLSGVAPLQYARTAPAPGSELSTEALSVLGAQYEGGLSGGLTPSKREGHEGRIIAQVFGAFPPHMLWIVGAALVAFGLGCVVTTLLNRGPKRGRLKV